MRLPGSAMIPICQGADVVFQKSVHACINLPLNHMVAHPVQLCPLPVRCSGDPYPLSLARRVELSPFWLPLTGYARSAARPGAPGLKAPFPGLLVCERRHVKLGIWASPETTQELPLDTRYYVP